MGRRKKYVRNYQIFKDEAFENRETDFLLRENEKLKKFIEEFKGEFVEMKVRSGSLKEK